MIIIIAYRLIMVFKNTAKNILLDLGEDINPFLSN